MLALVLDVEIKSLRFGVALLVANNRLLSTIRLLFEYESHVYKLDLSHSNYQRSIRG